MKLVEQQIQNLQQRRRIHEHGKHANTHYDARRHRFRLRAHHSTTAAASRGMPHSAMSPEATFAGSKRSFVTRAAKAAGGMKFSARTNPSGSCLPFNKKIGKQRQASMHARHTPKMMRKLVTSTVYSPTFIVVLRLSRRTLENANAAPTPTSAPIRMAGPARPMHLHTITPAMDPNTATKFAESPSACTASK